ncbi:MAG: DUF1365 domain-containing protein [Rhizobiaceae bacterium]
MTSANNKPNHTPARLCKGKVMHQRLKPFGHRFEYSVFSLLIDLDRLNEAHLQSRLFSVNRFNLAAFHERDHIDPRLSDPAKGIRAYADMLFAQAGSKRPHRIELFAYPRILGHAFNPITLYYGYNEIGALSGMIYEVRNTFGERHAYVCPVEQGELSAAGLRQTRRKLLHVSPFIGMAARYDFRLKPPQDSLQFRILESDEDGPLLAAAFSGQIEPMSSGKILKLCMQIPFLGLKIVGGIHFEAFRLWLKGARFHRSPPPPVPASCLDRPIRMTGE